MASRLFSRKGKNSKNRDNQPSSTPNEPFTPQIPQPSSQNQPSTYQNPPPSQQFHNFPNVGGIPNFQNSNASQFGGIPNYHTPFPNMPQQAFPWNTHLPSQFNQGYFSMGVMGNSSSEYVPGSPLPSNFPHFSTQPESEPEPEPENNQEADVQDDLVDESTPQSGKTIRSRWSTNETVSLCKSWENVSTDNYVGTNQNSTQFWQKVTVCYNEFRGDGNPRNMCQCKNHFSKMSRAVAKFSGAYNHALA